jgi:hypothetical protein
LLSWSIEWGVKFSTTIVVGLLSWFLVVGSSTLDHFLASWLTLWPDYVTNEGIPINLTKRLKD